MPSAGYSGTPLLKKLGVKEGDRVALVNPPADLPGELADLPAGVEPAEVGGDPRSVDVVVLFAPDAAALDSHLEGAKVALRMDGGLWIGWPKKSSGVETDLAREPVRDAGLAAGLVDNKVCAIDSTWSGLRFVYRMEDRG